MNEPAEHPPTCRVCRGTGWQEGPPIEVAGIHGEVLRIYTSLEPCTHHWTNDEPKPDEPVIGRDEYIARLAPDDPDHQRWQDIEHRWSLQP